MRRNQFIDQQYCFNKVVTAQKSEGTTFKIKNIENSADESQIPEEKEDKSAGNSKLNFHYPSSPTNQNPSSSDEELTREDFQRNEQPHEDDREDHNFKSSRVAQAIHGHQNLQEEDSKINSSPEDIWQIHEDDGVQETDQSKGLKISKIQKYPKDIQKKWMYEHGRNAKIYSLSYLLHGTQKWK